MSLKNIVWLASYPKSGNTWTRIFLANYLLGTDTPIPINEVHRVGIGDAIAKTYHLVAKGSFDPSDRMRVLNLREDVLRRIVGNHADVNFVKTHNRNAPAMGFPLVPPRFTKAAVYIIRHPLDVVMSYARHYGSTPSEAVRTISHPDNATSADTRNVEQYLGTWSDHVTSWTRGNKYPVHVMRYEDMQANPVASFHVLLEFLGITPDEAKLERAVRFSSFDEVRSQEDQRGFIEKPEQSEKFFHSGKVGQWQDVLSDDDIAFFRKHHGHVMKKFGYA